jgi:hypothetical protein
MNSSGSKQGPVVVSVEVNELLGPAEGRKFLVVTKISQRFFEEVG